MLPLLPFRYAAGATLSPLFDLAAIIFAIFSLPFFAFFYAISVFSAACRHIVLIFALPPFFIDYHFAFHCRFSFSLRFHICAMLFRAMLPLAMI